MSWSVQHSLWLENLNQSDVPRFQMLSESKPVAQKNYECQVCRAPIKKGTRHIRQVFLEDGEFGTSRSHFWCSNSSECILDYEKEN
jgi:hypothetical protein